MDYKDMNAIGIVRLMLTDGVISQDVAGKYFPELKESEDEKIRKELTDMLSDCANNIEHRFTASDCKRWLDWLEKQGEQKPAEINNICEFSIKTWIKIVDYVLTEHNGIGNYLIDPDVKDTAEKLQKKYKFDAASEEWDRVYRKGLDAGVNKGRAEALREQKPAWSEEDDNMLQSILDEYKSMPIEKRNWLNSLENRVQPQPKQEWSEEDKETLKDIITSMTNLKDSATSDALRNIYNSKIAWLKSLKPQRPIEWTMQDEEELQIALDTLVKAGQHSSAKWLKNVCLVPRNHWRPSEEQMKALQEAIIEMGKSVSPCSIEEFHEIQSLYCNLKKLTE